METKKVDKLLKALNEDTTEKIMHDLEDIVDSASLEEVLAALSNMCFEKAEHVRTNWQDEPLAKAWEKNGKLIDSIVERTTPVD